MHEKLFIMFMLSNMTRLAYRAYLCFDTQDLPPLNEDLPPINECAIKG